MIEGILISKSESYLLFEPVDVKKWWLWGYWFSPMMYAQNALAVNEFLGKSWSHVSNNITLS